jgi:hypothetical protein
MIPFVVILSSTTATKVRIADRTVDQCSPFFDEVKQGYEE